MSHATLSFTFPIETAGNAILSLPSDLCKVRITGKINTLRTMMELVGALHRTDIYILLDLYELEGLQFIGEWGTLGQAYKECHQGGYDFDSELGRETQKIYHGFSNTESLVSIILPPDIQFIGNESFKGCSNLEKLVIPEGVVAIGDYALARCTNLTEIQLPQSLRCIGIGTFEGCSNLKELVIPEGVESIGDICFNGCRNLEKIQLPSTLRDIGKMVFSYCDNIKELALPEGVEAIGCNFFSIFTKGPYDKSRDQSNLEKIQLPSTLRFIGGDTFKNCTSLKELVIPEGVESIGGNAFSHCSSLKKIEMKGKTPPDTSENSIPSEATIYVPAASVEDYRRKLPHNHVEAIEENTEDN